MRKKQKSNKDKGMALDKMNNNTDHSFIIGQ